MRHFKPKQGTKSATRILNTPFSDITAFSKVIQSLTRTNPLGCTSYMCAKRQHQPLEIVRQMYTAKFVYLNTEGKQTGRGLDMYDSVEGYQTGIAAIISNMANIASHRGKVKHMTEADLFSVLLKCHDPEGGLYFLSLARDRVTVASYSDDRIRILVEKWADRVPELA